MIASVLEIVVETWNWKKFFSICNESIEDIISEVQIGRN